MKTQNAGYQELDLNQYVALQKNLLREKGGKRQRQFLTSLKTPDQFIDEIAAKVKTEPGSQLPTFSDALTEASLKEPTEDQEALMYQLWSGIPPRIACRVSFWASVTLEHIKAGKIGHPTWLAANGGYSQTGEDRIKESLAASSSEKTNKDIDDCVRTVLRRMSGLPAARGNRSVFADACFGRGWWRERLVQSTLSQANSAKPAYPTATRDDLLAVLRRNRQYWEAIVMMIASRSSVLGSGNTQAAFINALAVRFSLNPNTKLGETARLKIALRRLSNIAASREIGILDFNEISALSNDLLQKVENLP